MDSFWFSTYTIMASASSACLVPFLPVLISTVSFSCFTPLGSTMLNGSKVNVFNVSLNMWLAQVFHRHLCEIKEVSFPYCMLNFIKCLNTLR